jgi:hypothetical protein
LSKNLFGFLSKFDKSRRSAHHWCVGEDPSVRAQAPLSFRFEELVRKWLVDLALETIPTAESIAAGRQRTGFF